MFGLERPEEKGRERNVILCECAIISPSPTQSPYQLHNRWMSGMILISSHTHTHVDRLAHAHTKNNLSTPFIFDVYKEMVSSNNTCGRCVVTANVLRYFSVCVFVWVCIHICVCVCVFQHASDRLLVSLRPFNCDLLSLPSFVFFFFLSYHWNKCQLATNSCVMWHCWK